MTDKQKKTEAMHHVNHDQAKRHIFNGLKNIFFNRRIFSKFLSGYYSPNIDDRDSISTSSYFCSDLLIAIKRKSYPWKFKLCFFLIQKIWVNLIRISASNRWAGLFGFIQYWDHCSLWKSGCKLASSLFSSACILEYSDHRHWLEMLHSVGALRF